MFEFALACARREGTGDEREDDASGSLQARGKERREGRRGADHIEGEKQSSVYIRLSSIDSRSESKDRKRTGRRELKERKRPENPNETKRVPHVPTPLPNPNPKPKPTKNSVQEATTNSPQPPPPHSPSHSPSSSTTPSQQPSPHSLLPLQPQSSTFSPLPDSPLLLLLLQRKSSHSHSDPHPWTQRNSSCWRKTSPRRWVEGRGGFGSILLGRWKSRRKVQGLGSERLVGVGCSWRRKKFFDGGVG